MDSSTIAGHIPPGTFARNNNTDSTQDLRKTPSNGLKPSEELAHVPQSAASIRFFATPELCERMLLFLRYPKRILQAAQVFKNVKNTIDGSSKLQRGLFVKPDLSTVTGTAVKRKRNRDRYYMEYNYRNRTPVSTPPPTERLVAINSLVFTTPCSRDDNQLLYLCLHIKKLYTAARPNLGSLATMFLTQPPVESVNVECHVSGSHQRITWQLDVVGGIQVQDLVDFIRDKSADPWHFRQAFGHFNPKYTLCLRLRDGDEVEEE